MPYNPNAIWTSKKKTYGHSAPPPTEPPKTSSVPPSPGVPEPKKKSEPKPKLPFDARLFFRRHALLIFSVGLVVFLGAVLAIAFLARPAANPSVSIAFSQPNSIPVGAPTVVTISSSNNSAVQLTGAVLTVTLPDSMSFVGEAASNTVEEYTLGTIDPGAVAAQSSTIIVTGAPESLQRINVKLTYSTPSTAQTTFETDGESNVVVGDSAISLSYAAPQNIVSEQSFTFSINYKNNTAQDIDDASIQAAYPPAFTFATSSIPATGGDDWNIGTILGGGSGSFTVTGTITGQAQAQYQMEGTVSLGASGEIYPVNIQPLTFVVTQPPLSLAITLNNSTTYISSAGDDLDYVLTYTNNSNISFSNVNISANLIGPMFNFSLLQTDGSFSSQSNTIAWSTANTPALASVAPGQSGSVTFSVKTKSTFPIKSPSDKNYVLKVIGTIQSSTVPPNTAGTSTVAGATLQNDVGGAIDLVATGYLKSGQYPPKVNQTTEYAIHWDITNYSTDAQNVTVSAYLQSGTTFAGAVSSTISSMPVYNAGTGQITWTIPKIAAGTGVITPPIETVFDVSNVPAVNQVGQDVTLLGPSSLAATDGFTGQALKASADPVTTALPKDTSVSGGQDNSVTE